MCLKPLEAAECEEKMKKLVALILTLVVLLVSSIPRATAAPSTKEEVIYGILNHDGSVDNLYVVNIFNGGSITDYGNYNKISNLTTRDVINQVDDKITITTDAEKVYYQGNLISKELPWNIDIKYYMDDKEFSALDLAGKSGKLKITISVTENPKVSSSIYDNFGLQISVSLDNKLSKDIVAEGASIAEAGANKVLSFTVLPGNPFEGLVTANVKNFEMDAISINAIRLVFNIDYDSSGFTKQFTELAKGIEDLDDGAEKLLEGINDLASGLTDYVDGLAAFKDGIGQLSSGANELHTGASSLSDGLSELINQNDNINMGANALLGSAFDAINAQLLGMDIGLPTLTPDNYSALLANIPDLAVIKLQLDGVVQFVQGLKEYTDGVEQLGKGADILADASKKFKDSSSEVQASAKAIYDGVVQINSGVKDLRDGMTSYKEGTKEFRDNTSNIDNGIEERINDILNELTGDDGAIESFVSDKNTNISSVQFVLKTAPIELPKAPSIVITEPVKLNFWQKFLKLFGLYKDK